MDRPNHKRKIDFQSVISVFFSSFNLIFSSDFYFLGIYSLRINWNAATRESGSRRKQIIIIIVCFSVSIFLFLFFCGRWFRLRWSYLSILSLSSFFILLQWPPQGRALPLDPPLFGSLTFLWRVLLAGRLSNGPRLRFSYFLGFFFFLFRLDLVVWVSDWLFVSRRFRGPFLLGIWTACLTRRRLSLRCVVVRVFELMCLFRKFVLSQLGESLWWEENNLAGKALCFLLFFSFISFHFLALRGNWNSASVQNVCRTRVFLSHWLH